MRMLSLKLTAWGAVLAGLLAPALSGAEFTTSTNQTYQVLSGAHLVVAVDRGNVRVRTGGDGEVRIEVEQRIDQVTESEAEQVFRQHELIFSGDRNQVKVGAKFNKRQHAAEHLRVNYSLTVPSKCNVDLNTSGGQITIASLQGTVKARTAAGNISTEKIAGPVEVQTAGGSISVGSARSVVARTSAGNIKITHCQESLRAETHGGSIKILEAGGTVDATTSAGNIEIQAAGAEVTATTAGGHIRIERAKSVTAKTSAGNIELGEIEGSANAFTSGGGIQVRRCADKLMARTSAGNIQVKALEGAADAQTSGGSIEARFSRQPKGPSRFYASAGGIRLTAPAQLAVELDARASAGSVESDFALDGLKPDRRHVKGKINGGGPALILQTQGGGITLRKS